MNIYLKLFLTFFKIGAFTFGGGYAMIPIIRQELENNGWLSMQEFIDIIAIAEMTPGPFAVNSATFIGIKISDLIAAAVATTAVALPSFITIIIASKFLLHFQEHWTVKGMLYGIRPTIAGLVATASVIIGQSALLRAGSGVHVTGLENIFCVINFKAVGIFLVSLVAIVKFKIHPIIIILIGALMGILII